MTISSRTISVFALLSISSQAPGEIDSGGGKSSGGNVFNHSSIGGSFATGSSQGSTAFNHSGLIEVIYPITPSSITDVDGNGLSDGWEVANFGPIGVDPNGDSDHDGASNLMEYLAGTNPNSASSVFRPQGTFTNGIFRMPVQTVSGRSYQVWATRNLKDWVLHSTLTGDGTVKTFEFDETAVTSGPLHSPEHPSNYFFRVQIVIP